MSRLEQCFAPPCSSRVALQDRRGLHHSRSLAAALTCLLRLQQPRQLAPNLRASLQQMVELLVTTRYRRRIAADLLLNARLLCLQSATVRLPFRHTFGGLPLRPRRLRAGRPFDSAKLCIGSGHLAPPACRQLVNRPGSFVTRALTPVSSPDLGFSRVAVCRSQ